MKTKLTDQRGIGHLVMVLIALSVILVISFVALLVSEAGNKTSSGSAVKQAKASDCLKTQHDSDLCNFISGYALDKQSYKLTNKSTDTNGSGTIVYLSDGKGNTSVADDSDGSTSNIIFYNGVAYLRDDSDGQWFKFARGDKNAPPNSNPAIDLKFDAKADGTISYKKIGREKCNGTTCLKYQLIDTTDPGLTQYFWFDTSDYKLQRYSYQDSASSGDMTFTYLPVHIKAPSPTKDFTPPDDSASDSNGDSTSSSE